MNIVNDRRAEDLDLKGLTPTCELRLRKIYSDNVVLEQLWKADLHEGCDEWVAVPIVTLK